MEENMRKIGRKISIMMGISMSLCLSLVGTLTSGHFTVPGFLLSFLVSTIISLIIGFVIPMGKVGGNVLRRMGLQRGSIKARLMETLVSDLIYTPVITFAMVFLAYKMAMISSNGMAQLHFLPMFLKSLVICFIVGFVAIFFIQPIIMKIVMEKNM